jgi:hypothetical protein|tara:strand:+ start:3372 stop:3974 length:603 start_codon:yes stop_codon:yes gene_type:complete
MIKVTPFDAYKSYLGLKNHFTKPKYDYHRYGGKSRATIQSFYKRRDRYFFEKLSRQKTDDEVVEFFVSNFISCDNPQSLWIGDIVRNGEGNYTSWKKRMQSMSYLFKEQMETLFSDRKFDDVFKIEGTKHPIILKELLQDNISIEAFIVLEKILGFKKDFDKRLDDPVWEFVSMRTDKYISFLDINVFHYKKILKQVVGL